MSKYFDKLESLRGVAAFAVVLYHSPFYHLDNPNKFVANSYLFVDFFFILSGFVMASAYREKIAGGFKFRDYFFLRLGRIYPLHFTLLLVWVLYILLKWILFSYQIELADPLKFNTVQTFISNLLLIHSLNLQINPSWNYPSWSISVEFFTYFIFFAFALLSRKWKNPWFALILSAAVYFYLFNSSNWQSLDWTLINGIYRCIGGFFAGVFLFQVMQKTPQLDVYLISILEILSVILVVWVVTNASTNKVFLFSSIPAFAFVICVFSQTKAGLIGKVLKLKFFIDAGKYSYSVYLTHALILDIAFSLTKYFILKPTEEIFYFQSNWSYLVNAGLFALIYFVSKITYQLIEKPWVEKSRNLVGQLNKFDQIEEKKSVFV